MRERRREAQPSGIKTFGSTFKNPEDERAEGRIGRAAARGGRLPRPAPRRRPLLREARQLRRERSATATTADVLELMAEGRRRVHERFGVELEPEVQVLGEVRWPERLGAVRRRLVGDRWSLVVVVAVAVYWFVVRDDDASSRSVAGPAADGDDRRRRGSGRRSPATAPSSAGCRCPRTRRCRELPLDEVAERRPARAARCCEQVAGPRRRPAGAAPLPRQQLLRRERGGRRTSRPGSNCASATPRRRRGSGRRRPRSSPTRRSTRSIM